MTVVPEVYETNPARLIVLLRTTSAEKSASPVSGSSMYTCLTEEKSCGVTAEIVKSVPEPAVALSSTTSSEAVLPVDLISSPTVNVPTTEVRTSDEPEVEEET